MRKLIPLIALSSLALSACMEESNNDNSAANDTNNAVQNPFAVATNDPQTNPVQTNPVQTEPVQQIPTPTNLQAALINGANATTARSYWSCAEQTEDGEIFIAFYADGRGEINDTIDTADLTWAIDGPYMDISINGDFYAQLSQFDLSANGLAFDVSYVVYDGTAGALSCDLTTNNTGDTASPPSVPGPITNSTDRDLLVNTFAAGVLQDVWLCSASDGSNIALFFDNDGSGVLITNTDYSDGITTNWTLSTQNIELVLADGNQVEIISPLITQDYFAADTVIVNGSSSGSIDCERVSEV